MDEKLKSENAQKSSFLNILRAIRTGRCRERRYADHIFIQIYFRMHHFVVKFSKISSPQAARGHWPPNENPADPPGCRRGVQNSLAINTLRLTSTKRVSTIKFAERAESSLSQQILAVFHGYQLSFCIA